MPARRSRNDCRSSSDEEEDFEEGRRSGNKSWKISPAKVSAKLSQCFDHEGFDVTLLVAHSGSGRIAGEEPPAKAPRSDGHRRQFHIWSTLLCQWSEVFEAMLTSGMRESKGVIEIADFSSDTVEASLRFMYSGKLVVKSNQIVQLVEVAAFAGKYAIHELRALTIRALAGGLSSEIGMPELKHANFTVKELRSLGRTACHLLKHTFGTGELKAAGFSASDFKYYGFSAMEAVAEGFTGAELLWVGFHKLELELAGIRFAPSLLRAQDFKAYKLKEAGFTVAELKQGGFMASELTWYMFESNKVFSLIELAVGGFSPSELKAENFTAQEFFVAGFTASALKAAEFSAVELKVAGFTACSLVEACFSGAELLNASFHKLELELAGVSLTPSLLRAQTAVQLKEAGFTVAELKQGGFMASELKVFSLAELAAGGFSASELKAESFTAQEFLVAGVTASALKAAEFSAVELKVAGFTACSLAEAGFSIDELKEALVTSADLRSAGYPEIVRRMDEDRLHELEGMMSRGRPNVNDFAFVGAQHEDLQVRDFLRSSARTMTLHCGQGVAHAHDVARRLSQECTHYSVLTRVDGRGKKTSVEINKTKELHKRRIPEFDANLREAQKLRAELSS